MKTYVITGYMTQLQRDEMRDRRRKKAKRVGGLVFLLCGFLLLYVVTT